MELASAKVDAEVKTGRIAFTIEKWSALPNEQGAGILSSVLDCAGFKWKLQVFPGGDREAASDDHALKATKKKNVGLFLHRVSLCNEQVKVVQTEYKLRIVNQIPGPWPHKSHSFEHAFDKKSSSAGTIEAIRQSDLSDPSKGFKVNDRVIIEADITTIGPLIFTTEAAVPAVISENMKTDFLHLLRSSKDADVTFSVFEDASSSSSNGLIPGSKTFRAHSVIIKARSPYLCTMLSSGMVESSSKRIVEKDIQPAAFEKFLLYLYTDSVSAEAMESMAEHLLLAANKYQCEGLQQTCEAHMSRSLSVKNVAARLILSDQTESEVLKKACMGFIKCHAPEVMKTENWAQVKTNAPLLNEILQALFNVPQASKRLSADATCDEEPSKRRRDAGEIEHMK